MTKKLRIVYMGSPAFAVPPLKALIDEGYTIPAVVTSPDKPAGRGRKMQSSKVKIFAEQAGLKILQPVNLKDPDFLEQLREMDADLHVVVAFRMLPEQVWSMPPAGTINLHASLLPQYRGAAPINHVIMNGERVTGITTFFINQDIDTGQVILQKEVGIPEDFTAGDLHDVLMREGAILIVKSIKLIEKGLANPIPQDQLIKPGEMLKLAPKIFKEDCLIDWNQCVTGINNFIRGLSPSPAAYSFLNGPSGKFMIRFFRAGYRHHPHSYAPGRIIIENRKEFGVFAKDGLIFPQIIQQEGKKRMSTGDFLNGIPNLDQYSFGET